MQLSSVRVVVVGLLLTVTLLAARAAAGPLTFTGVSLAGGDFYTPAEGTRGVYGTQFFYPTEAEAIYFSAHGVNVVRIPFMWETLQPRLSQPFLMDELTRYVDVVHTMEKHGLTVLIDPHSYARHYGKVIGSDAVSDADFADFWRQLATPFKGDDHVWFGLMNEPHDLPNQQWLDAANAAITAIRATGAKNLLLVPGISWTGAHSWVDSGNGVTMLGVVDPEHHFIFEVHQYLDEDSSGTHPGTVSPMVGSERVRQFTQWCVDHHQRAFLGEFAAADSPVSHQAIDDLLRYLQAHADVWTGFTWWAAGPRWGEYMYTLEPTPDGRDRPQMTWLRPYLQPVK